MMQKRTRLGISSSLYCLPLVHQLCTNDHFELVVNAATPAAIALRGRQLEAAFISPIDYARESSEYVILPGIAVSAQQGNETVVLHFREGLRKVKTLAADPSFASEIILATILLQEQFDISTRIVPAVGSLESLLAKADAALLVGDAAFMEPSAHRNKLDLIETWNDMTDLPYVHGFWCCREQDLTVQEVQSIQQANDRGNASLDEIAAEASTRPGGRVSVEAVKNYLGSFSYHFTESARAGLNEFLRYAYFHGILPDVAVLHFYGIDEEADRSDISLN